MMGEKEKRCRLKIEERCRLPLLMKIEEEAMRREAVSC